MAENRGSHMKRHWEEARELARVNGWTVSRARDYLKHKSNGHAPVAAKPRAVEPTTPEALVALANEKAREIEVAIDLCQRQLQDLQADLARWTRVARSLDCTDCIEDEQTDLINGCELTVG